MKTLVLTILLGLAYASQAMVDISKFSGGWKTHYFGLSHPWIIGPTIKFEGFIKDFRFEMGDKMLNITMLLNVNGECDYYNLKARKIQHNLYILDYLGITFMSILGETENGLVLHHVFFAEDGCAITGTSLIGKENQINQEDFEKYKELNIKYNIPEENIHDVATYEICPKN